MTIDEQVNDLRKIFKTKNILDQSSLIIFSDNQINKIIALINKKKKDGDYEIDEDLLLLMKTGKVIICDNIESV